MITSWHLFNCVGYEWTVRWIWKNLFRASHFNTLFQHFCGRTEENHRSTHSSLSQCLDFNIFTANVTHWDFNFWVNYFFTKARFWAYFIWNRYGSKQIKKVSSYDMILLSWASTCNTFCSLDWQVLRKISFKYTMTRAHVRVLKELALVCNKLQPTGYVKVWTWDLHTTMQEVLYHLTALAAI
jgi:hypothetical protein